MSNMLQEALINSLRSVASVEFSLAFQRRNQVTTWSRRVATMESHVVRASLRDADTSLAFPGPERAGLNSTDAKRRKHLISDSFSLSLCSIHLYSSSRKRRTESNLQVAALELGTPQAESFFSIHLYSSFRKRRTVQPLGCCFWR